MLSLSVQIQFHFYFLYMALALFYKTITEKTHKLTDEIYLPKNPYAGFQKGLRLCDLLGMERSNSPSTIAASCVIICVSAWMAVFPLQGAHGSSPLYRQGPHGACPRPQHQTWFYAPQEIPTTHFPFLTIYCCALGA